MGKTILAHPDMTGYSGQGELVPIPFLDHSHSSLDRNIERNGQLSQPLVRARGLASFRVRRQDPLHGCDEVDSVHWLLEVIGDTQSESRSAYPLRAVPCQHNYRKIRT